MDQPEMAVGDAACEVQPHVVALIIGRAEIEACESGRVVDMLITLTDGRARVEQLADSLLFSVDGYDADPRELWEIPEVVRFFGAVNAAWSYWGHFLAKTADQFSTLLLLLMQARAVDTSTSGKPLRDTFTTDDLLAVARELFASMNGLYATFDIDDQSNIAMTNKIARVVGECAAGTAH